jgi:Spy/CpxP family protein refolding chaperone
MKKSIVAVLALVMVAFSASAQHQRMQKNGQHKKAMAQQLNLSDAQKAQAKANHELFKKQMQELNKNENITVKEFRDRKAAMHKDHKAAMQNLLTPEQKAQMAQMKADKKAKRAEMNAKRMDRMKQQLQLSDDQMTKMKAAREGLKTKLQAIKNNEGLDRQQRKEQMMALKKDQKVRFDNILTAEQKEKLKTLRQKRSAKTEAK